MRSLKKELILSFAHIPSAEGMERNRIVILTSAGLIIGDLARNQEDADAILLSKLTQGFCEDYFERNGITSDNLDSNDGFISLENVTIRSSGMTNTIPFLNVFFDQIIGISLGNV